MGEQCFYEAVQCVIVRNQDLSIKLEAGLKTPSSKILVLGDISLFVSKGWNE